MANQIGQSNPNPASWLGWSILSILNAFSYSIMNGNWVLAFQYYVSAVMATATFFYVFKIGKLDQLKIIEWIVVVLTAIAGFFWLYYQNSTGANMIILVAYLFSYAPTLVDVVTDRRREGPWPWWLWTLASGLTLSNVAIANKSWISYINPITLVITYGLIAVLAIYKRKKRLASV